MRLGIAGVEVDGAAGVREGVRERPLRILGPAEEDLPHADFREPRPRGREPRVEGGGPLEQGPILRAKFSRVKR